MANMSKVYDVRQGPGESQAVYLERLQEAFRRYTPHDPEAGESQTTVMFAFINQAAQDIKRKLQSIDRLGEKHLRDLVAVAEKVSDKRENLEDKELRKKEREKSCKSPRETTGPPSCRIEENLLGYWCGKATQGQHPLVEI
ncbi:putative Gag polyprotein [Cricetulus griseus]|nr:putative Gag polyprotein [Cricetulus griseus]